MWYHFWGHVNIEEMDCDTYLIVQEILSDEIDDEEFLEFAIENLEELFSYIINGNLNIRIHRDIAGDMWFGLGYDSINLPLPFLPKYHANPI